MVMSVLGNKFTEKCCLSNQNNKCYRVDLDSPPRPKLNPTSFKSG